MSIIGDGIMLGAGGDTASIFVTRLNETDTVTASKDGKTIVGKWTHRLNPAAHGLPYGYTELEYTESTGTQYIDTLLKPTVNTSVIIDYQLTSITKDFGVFGCGIIGDPTSTFWTFRHSGDMEYAVNLSYGQFTFPADTSKHHLEFNSDRKVVLDGSHLGTFTATSLTQKYNLRLFGYVEDDTNRYNANVKIYNCSIRESNALIHDFVPCIRNSDGAIGLYDLVSKSFFGNAGTGTFVAGPEIPQTLGDGFLIDKIKSYGTWTVTATRGTSVSTRSVLVDSASVLNIKISFRLPNGYIELNNIISGEGAYLDTGINLNTLTNMTLQALAPAISERVIAGAWKGGAGFMFGVSSHPDGDTAYRTSSGETWTNSGIHPDGKYHLFEMNYSSGLYIDGKYVTGAVPRYSANVHLFGSNGYGSGYADVSIKSCQMFNGETKLRDFVPAIRDSDGAVGMYDLVSNSFFVSANSGLFIAGEEA